MTADPDRACRHENFAADVEVHRLTSTEGGPVTGFTADVSLSCADCGEKFRWIGAPAGVSPRNPACSVDETVLHAPCRPSSADPDFGLGLPGFSVRADDGRPARPGRIGIVGGTVVLDIHDGGGATLAVRTDGGSIMRNIPPGDLVALRFALGPS